MVAEREKTKLPELEDRVGLVVAVCLSDKREYPKFPQDKVIVGKFGFEGDAHAGEFRKSYSNPDKLKPNDRAISIVANESRQELSRIFGIEIQPGDFNENILISGLGDLSDLRPGDRLYFSSGVILEITAQNFPCQKLESYLAKKGVVKSLITKNEDHFINRRGLVTTVLRQGELESDGTVKVVRLELSMGD